MVYQSTLLFLLLPLAGSSPLSPTQVVYANNGVHQDEAEVTAARIADLQSSEYAKRQAAMQQLASVRFEELVQVLPLLTSEDAEVSWRAREVLIQQGVRGNPDQVRRIGLLLQLLAKAGYQQFAKDAIDFDSRVESLRTRELLRKIQQIDGVQVNEGFQIVGNVQFRGGAGMGLGGGRAGVQVIEVAPRVFILEPGNPNPQIRVLEENQEITDPRGAASQDVQQGSGDSDQESPETETISQETIRSNLADWIQQCIVATPEQLEHLENEWRRLNLLHSPQPQAGGVVTSYNIVVTRPITEQQLETLRQFMNARVLVSLSLFQVELTQGWISAIVQAAQRGTLQRLDTEKCIYDLESYLVLNELLTNKKLPYWDSKGRAMLGIISSNAAFDRLDLPERGELGARVNEVTPNSAAEAAGILPGDRIIFVNEIPVRSFEELRRLIAVFGVGDLIQVQIARPDVADSIKVQVSLMQHAQ